MLIYYNYIFSAKVSAIRIYFMFLTDYKPQSQLVWFCLIINPSSAFLELYFFVCYYGCSGSCWWKGPLESPSQQSHNTNAESASLHLQVHLNELYLPRINPKSIRGIGSSYREKISLVGTMALWLNNHNADYLELVKAPPKLIVKAHETSILNSFA